MEIFSDFFNQIFEGPPKTEILQKQKGRVSFTIQDNGSGFDKTWIMGAKGPKPGQGIPSMEERIRLLGGSIDIQTEPGAGTIISFTLPTKNH